VREMSFLPPLPLSSSSLPFLFSYVCKAGHRTTAGGVATVATEWHREQARGGSSCGATPEGHAGLGRTRGTHMAALRRR
jgi:hypothetical protein